MQGKLARPVWGWGPGETPGPTPLFLGHPQAAASRLRLLSIISSAHRHELKIEQYLESILRELAWAAQNRPSDLELGSDRLLKCLPDNWMKNHPDGIRAFRREESADKSERARYVKARRRIERRKLKNATTQKNTNA